jgi:hypothetical protein
MFFAYKYGRVEVKELLTITNRKDAWIVVSGGTILLEIQKKSTRVIVLYGDIARVIWRSVIGYNSNEWNAVFATRPYNSIELG